MHSRLAALLLLFAAAMPAANGAPTVLQVSAVIGPRVFAQLQSAPRMLVLEQVDLDRGYVDIPAPLVIRLRSNLAHPFTLEFRSAHDVVSSIAANALSMPLLQAPGGGLLVPATAGEQSLTVQVRLYLGPHAMPGSYPWPVRLAGAG
ncbi:MAG: hypothetical protein NVS2B4_01720 [Ramlibacter sp.]